MWYAILLLCGVWNNCFAMEYDQSVTIYKDRPVTDGTYQHPGDDALREKIHAYRQQQSDNGIPSRAVGMTAAAAIAVSQNGKYIAHADENNLMLVRTDKDRELVLPLTVKKDDGKTKDEDASRKFVACSVYQHNLNIDVFGVDNKKKLHHWDVFWVQAGDRTFIPCTSYTKWNGEVPEKSCPIIRHIAPKLAAIFWENKRMVLAHEHESTNRTMINLLGNLRFDHCTVTKQESRLGEGLFKLRRVFRYLIEGGSDKITVAVKFKNDEVEEECVIL